MNAELVVSIAAGLLQEVQNPEAAVEAALIQRAAKGESAAFRLLLEQHQAHLFRFCRHWLVCEEDTREVCQDAFVRAWHALPSYRHHGRFRSWLIRIALNLCRDRARSRRTRQARRTVSLEESGSDTPCGGQRPDDASLWREEMEKLAMGLESLPERLRLPLVLCCVEGMSQEECAEVLGSSVRAVEGRIHRARKRLLTWWEAQS